MASKLTGKEREVALVTRANRACAVGRLMLAELKSWDEFLKPETDDFSNLSRGEVKGLLSDVKKRIRNEIKKFCSRNFEGLKEASLERLYLDIKANRGLSLPLEAFEEKYGQVKPKVLGGKPKHATVVISLWGLQFMFPEDFLSKDVMEALRLGKQAAEDLERFESVPHRLLEEDRDEIAKLVRTKEFTNRSCIIACFNLVEAYLNGLAWDFCRDQRAIEKLSNRRQQLLKDSYHAKFKDKLIKYSKIITGQNLWDETDEQVTWFLDVVKRYRDALVHPSPFSVPNRFEDYEKLALFYEIDLELAQRAAQVSNSLLRRMHLHIQGSKASFPDWLESFSTFVGGLGA